MFDLDPRIARRAAGLALLGGVFTVLALAPPAAATGGGPGAEVPSLTFDRLFADDERLLELGDLSFSPDGRRLTYLWDDGQGQVLWLLDLPDGEPRALIRPGQPGPAAQIELDAWHWSPSGKSLLLESGGDLFLFDLVAGRLDRLTETEAAEEDPKFSPDGRRLAYVRQANLYLLDFTEGAERAERALTTDGEEGILLNGVTDWVYWEELWGRDSTGYWWSPGGGQIAYYRFDERPVERYPLVNFLSKYPEVEWQRYPKAGTSNPKVRVGVLDVDGGETTWLETGPDTEYLARVDWTPAGDRLAVQRLNRDQNRLDLLLCDPAGGACRTILTEAHPTWVNLGEELRFLPDGRFVWDSEASGWRQLYLHAADGSAIRRLTDGEGAVTSLDAVDAAGGWVTYTAFEPGTLGAARRQVYRARLDGSVIRRLTDRTGWNGVLVAPESGYWVHSWSDAENPEELTLHGPGGAAIRRLGKPAPLGFDPAALPKWTFFTIPGTDGAALPARMLEPAGRRPGEKYPVIMYHYGCPASQVVNDRWDRRGRDLWHKMMAQRGYGVLMVDNQASIFFGKAGEDRAHRRFGPGNLAAQKAGVEYLKSLPWVDGERIGLWGWSGGGSNTLYNLLNSPGTWRAGVAGAPVTDWRLYDTIWTERYLDHPDDNPEGYDASSPVTYAHKLADPLLIVHGTADDNVHPQNTLVMINALVEAGRPFEDAIYPRQKHGFKGASNRHFYERMTEFFDRHLDGTGVPEVSRPDPLP